MKTLKSIITFVFLGGMLGLATGCPPDAIIGTALIGGAALNCMAWCNRGPVYVAPAPIYVAPPVYLPPTYIAPGVYVPPTVIRPGPFTGPGGCQPGPFGCISMNDETQDQLIDLGNKKYGIAPEAMKTLVAALISAQNGDVSTAANKMGLNSKMLTEAKNKSISDDSANQIASAIGATPESVQSFVHDLNDSLQNKNGGQDLLPANFDNSNDHSG